jgi:hypothetical protein
MPVTVKVHVPPDLKRALGADMRKAVKRASLELGNELERTMSDYPPESEANKARGFGSTFGIATRKAQNRWYQRGYGPRWARKDGSIGGRPTSEQLGQRWAVVSKRWGAIVGSPVAYSPVVQHHKEQAKFHKARGWVTDKMAVEKLVSSGKVDRAVKAAVKWALKGR